MNSITPTVTENNPTPKLGSAMAELLTQVPPTLAERIRDAAANDLMRVFKVGLDAGQQNVWAALKDQGFTVPAVATSKPHLTLVSGGAR